MFLNKNAVTQEGGLKVCELVLITAPYNHLTHTTQFDMDSTASKKLFTPLDFDEDCTDL